MAVGVYSKLQEPLFQSGSALRFLVLGCPSSFLPKTRVHPGMCCAKILGRWKVANGRFEWESN